MISTLFDFIVQMEKLFNDFENERTSLSTALNDIFLSSWNTLRGLHDTGY
jgi:hypothetical protein